MDVLEMEVLEMELLEMEKEGELRGEASRGEGAVTENDAVSFLLGLNDEWISLCAWWRAGC